VVPGVPTVPGIPGIPTPDDTPEFETCTDACQELSTIVQSMIDKGHAPQGGWPAVYNELGIDLGKLGTDLLVACTAVAKIRQYKRDKGM
jgi:hypothetical protein